jgi:hypothetical protein
VPGVLRSSITILSKEIPMARKTRKPALEFKALTDGDEGTKLPTAAEVKAVIDGIGKTVHDLKKAFIRLPGQWLLPPPSSRRWFR